MHKRNRIFRWFMVLILTISTVTTGTIPVCAAAGIFTDIPDDAYYAESVGWAVDNEITKGTSDTMFSPDDGCTRAQCVTFLYRYAGSPDVDAEIASIFKDVKRDEYYAKAVAWAVENEITTGTSDTTFSPNEKCTRAQIVTFLWRYNSEPTVENTCSFVDVTGNNYYSNAVSWAVEKEITKGTSDTTFSPDQTCTRGQIVTFLYRLFQVQEENTELEDIMLYDTEEEHIVSGELSFDGISYEGEYVDNEILIMVSDDVEEADVDAMMESYGGISLGYIKQAGLYQIVFNESKTLNELYEIISELKMNRSVLEAGLNTVSSYETQSIDYPENDPWISGKTDCNWNEKIPGGTNWGFEAINAASARQMVKEYYQDKGQKVPEIKMGIIDGYLYNFTIQGVKELSYEDIYYTDSQYSLDDSDELMRLGENADSYNTFSRYSHGNHVAGIFGAKADNGQGITGIALNPKIYGCSVTDHGSASDKVFVRFTEADSMVAVAVLIQKCGQKYPAIINYSMGCGKEQSSETSQIGMVSQKAAWMGLFLKTILEKKKGDFLIVTSAGNGESPCKDAEYNNEFTCISKELKIRDGKLNCQDVVDRILVVGASNSNFEMESGDNYGSRIDVMAPGEDVYSLTPANENSEGTGANRKAFSEGQTVYKKSGTSEAAPHAAGTAALMLAADPSLNGAALKKLILNSSDILLSTPDTKKEYHPMINAANAVASVLGKPYSIGSDSDSPVEWSLSSDGKLTVQGSGELKPVENGKYEWSRWASSITTVEVNGNITSIGSKAFHNCRNLKTIDLPESIKHIEMDAMTGDENLKSIIIRSKSQDIVIEDNAMDANGNPFTLYGYKGSGVQNYADELWDTSSGTTNAQQYNFHFIPLYDGTGEIPETNGYTLKFKDFLTDKPVSYVSLKYSNSRGEEMTVVPENGIAHLDLPVGKESPVVMKENQGPFFLVPSDWLSLAYSIIGDGNSEDTWYLTQRENAVNESEYRVITFSNNPSDLLKKGICGDHLLWEFDKDYVLHIYGSGAMYDFNKNTGYLKEAPWIGGVNYGVREVELSGSVTEIGASSFSYNMGALYQLEKVTFNQTFSLKRIGKNAFTNALFSELILPDSVTVIEKEAFSRSGLKRVFIPKNVKELHDSAFFNCNSLTDVYFGGTEAEWKAILIRDTDYTNSAYDALSNAKMHYESNGFPDTPVENSN